MQSFHGPWSSDGIRTLVSIGTVIGAAPTHQHQTQCIARTSARVDAASVQRPRISAVYIAALVRQHISEPRSMWRLCISAAHSAIAHQCTWVPPQSGARASAPNILGCSRVGAHRRCLPCGACTTAPHAKLLQAHASERIMIGAA
jgi:hypothetical protein